MSTAAQFVCVAKRDSKDRKQHRIEDSEAARKRACVKACSVQVGAVGALVTLRDYKGEDKTFLEDTTREVMALMTSVLSGGGDNDSI